MPVIGMILSKAYFTRSGCPNWAVDAKTSPILTVTSSATLWTYHTGSEEDSGLLKMHGTMCVKIKAPANSIKKRELFINSS
jgi:hypothetical protein